MNIVCCLRRVSRWWTNCFSFKYVQKIYQALAGSSFLWWTYRCM